MIVAAGGDGGADEDRIDEQRGGDFLQPQPGVADGPRDDVEHHRKREAETQHAAEHHQDQFELVERAPFQVTLPLQHQFVGDGIVTRHPAVLVMAGLVPAIRALSHGRLNAGTRRA